MRNVYKIAALLTAVFFTTGCKKYLDINSNPAVPQVVPAEFLLPPIEYQMANGTSQDYMQMWKITQNMSGVSTNVATTVWDQHGYTAASDVTGVVWRMTYVDLGLNLENLINDAVKNQKYEYAAIGYAIKAWAFQTTTDMYGPIILDQAFTVGKLTFNYQDQPDVYARVREWAALSLKYANMKSPLDWTTQLKGTTGDGMYLGDMAKWKKFVYSLLAIQYGHLIHKAEFKTQYADSVSKYVDLSFASEAEDASIFFAATTTANSSVLGPAKGYMLTNSLGFYYGRPTTTILNYLTGGVRGTPTPNDSVSIDPRLSRYLAANAPVPPATKGIYTAVVPTQGSTTPTVPAVYGLIAAGSTTYTGRYIFADKARFPLMTYSELQFVKSEALFIKGDAPNAYTAYINGIKASMDFFNQYGRTSGAPDPAIAPTDVTAYLTSTEVAQSAADLTMTDIMGQKYIALWGWAGLETWCDLRKYHYDPLIFRTYHQLTAAQLFTSNAGKYSYRFRPRYNSEYVWNPTELAKWGGLNPNYNTQELWFSLP